MGANKGPLGIHINGKYDNSNWIVESSRTDGYTFAKFTPATDGQLDIFVGTCNSATKPIVLSKYSDGTKVGEMVPAVGSDGSTVQRCLGLITVQVKANTSYVLHSSANGDSRLHGFVFTPDSLKTK